MNKTSVWLDKFTTLVWLDKFTTLVVSFCFEKFTVEPIAARIRHLKRFPVAG